MLGHFHEGFALVEGYDVVEVGVLGSRFVSFVGVEVFGVEIFGVEVSVFKVSVFKVSVFEVSVLEVSVFVDIVDVGGGFVDVSYVVQVGEHDGLLAV